MTTTAIDIYSFRADSWGARVTESEERIYDTDVIWQRDGFPDPYTAFQQAALALSLARPKLAISPVWPGSCENDPYLVRQALDQIKAAKVDNEEEWRNEARNLSRMAGDLD